MLRILTINDRASIGGAEQIIADLRGGMLQRGHQVRSLSATCDRRVEYRCWSSDAWYSPLVRLANPSAVLTLRRALAEFRPDVVHVGMFMHQLSPLILAVLKGYPTLYYSVLYEADCPKGTRWLPQKAPCHHRAGLVCARHCLSPQAWVALMAQRGLLRYWVRNIHEFVTISQHLSTMLKRDGWPVAGVIEPGVFLPELAEQGSEPVIACVARLAPEKGVDTLMVAFARVLAQLPDSRLWIVGDGPERARLEQLARELELGDRVVFWGSLPRAQVDPLLARARVQVVPSRWEETFGLVACEAGALGLPVIVSRLGGLQEIVVEGETGYCVEPGQSEPLAQALVKVLGDPERARQMGLEGRARVARKYSQEKFLDRFEARYRKLAGSA